MDTNIEISNINKNFYTNKIINETNANNEEDEEENIAKQKTVKVIVQK